ncbi:NADH-quinone oxidoreductase subunit N [Salipaludibacillus keqinensis]|uniref:NADH-quinone oxidoreductase subunit N n=1 Tax=Salipaludibacillus keqinensis TaxID=2045207 RepID=A0A323TIN0_9BACI|nr:NADH-quinone oxidoreductase subunit N [Salipaludibacillus keqinensis]PYZ92513.1 NADH-quinone oxidoreductase subunit N [Salipaludibacillus keqinensis]
MTAFDANWSLMTPEIVLAALALLVFTIDFMTGIHGKKPFIGKLSVMSLLVTAVLVFLTNSTSGQIADVFVVDGFAMIFKLIILVGVAMVILISMNYLDRNEEIYQGEYYSILLFSALGAMIMVSSADLITLFIGLEILSISSYCLVGFKKYHRHSTEAAIKYVILGGTASAFILYGMSFLYGLTGSTSLRVIGEAMPQLFADYSVMMTISFIFMLVGFGFKISIVPFHMWAPDVYEGAPTPITAFLSVVSKIAGFGIVLRVMVFGFLPVYEEWIFIIAVLAAVTMIVGNAIALTQKNTKRLMAYSGIAQAGYLLVPIAALPFMGNFSLSMILFYSVAYLMMTLGAFAVITLVTEDAGTSDLSSFAGLFQRSPYLAVAMTVFLVSLAGLPLTAGFIGKAQIFFGAVSADLLWLAIIMIVMSVVSFFYYFSFIKQMFMTEPKANDKELQVPVSLSAVVTVALAVTIILGIMPNFLLDIFTTLNWFALF